MFNDGIMPDWDFEKLCQQFYPHYISYYGIDKDLWKKFSELFAEEAKKEKETKKKDIAKSTVKKSTAQKSTKPVEKSTKPKDTQEDEDKDEDLEAPIDILQTLLNVLTGTDDTPKGKHEKSEPPKMPPEVKKYMDNKTKVNLADEPKTKSTEGEKKMQTITITLTNSKTITWTSDNYDDYKLTDTCFIIKKNGEYVGIYNMKFVTSIVVK